MSRTSKPRLNKDDNEALSDVKRGWARAARIALCVISLAVLSLQWYSILGEPRFRASVLILVVGTGLLWRRRSWIGAARRGQQTMLARCFVFPGYLLVLCVATALASFWLRSLSLASLASLFYLGWFVGRRCDRHGWVKLAPVWMMLFVVCFAFDSDFILRRFATVFITQRASEILDNIGVYHRLVGISELRLIDSKVVIDLDPNDVFSSYLLLVSLACGIAFGVWPVARSVLSMATTVLIGTWMIPMRMIVAGLLESSAWGETINHSERLLSGVVLMLSVLMIISTLCFIQFVTSTRRSLDSTQTWMKRFNDWMNASWGALMFGRDRHAIKPVAVTGQFVWSVISSFSKQYVKSRSWLLLLGGLPSLTIAGLSISHMSRLVLPTVDRLSMQRGYQDNLTQRLSAERSSESDFAVETELVMRLRELAPSDYSPSIALANAYVDAGKFADGEQIIGQLIDAGVHDTSLHLWLAKRCLARDFVPGKNLQLSQVRGSDASEAETHFAAAIANDTANWDAVSTYAGLLAGRGKLTDAARVIGSQKFQIVEQEMRAVHLLRCIGLQSDAVKRAGRVVQEIQTVEPSQRSVQQVLMLASAHLIRNERHEAAQSLELSLNSGGDDSSIRELLVQVHLELCRLAGADEVSSRAEHFQSVMMIDPDNDELLQLAAQFLFALNTQAESDLLAQCRTIVEQAIRADTLPPDVYVILGTGAASQGRLSVGEKYLRSAYDRGVRSASLLNNLAWVISQEQSGDFAFALQLVDDAIRADPASRDAFLTRADIHIALANYLAAIADLERIYEAGEHSSEITQRLAECYEAIGEADIASGLRKRMPVAR